MFHSQGHLTAHNSSFKTAVFSFLYGEKKNKSEQCAADPHKSQVYCIVSIC